MGDKFGHGFQEIDESEQRTLLTPREVEVLRAVSSGSTNKQIARELGISQHTVKFHLESLMRKLDASSRAEAVYKSIQLKLLESYSI
jgi:DNA-binding NarL/FixJ family response regulator